MCLGIKSISNLHMVNNELRKTVEYLFVSRAKSIFKTHFEKQRKKSKFGRKNISSHNAGDIVEESVGEKWLRLMEFLDEQQLWSCNMQENVFLCLIRIFNGFMGHLPDGGILDVINSLKLSQLNKFYPFFMAVDLACNFGNSSLIEVATCLQKSSSDLLLPINLNNYYWLSLDLAIRNKFTKVVNELIQFVDFKEDIEDENCKHCTFIKLAVEHEDLDLLKSLFQLLIKAHLEKMESIYLPISLDNPVMISALNHPCPHLWLMPMSPLHKAAQTGNIEMIRLFVDNIKYINYVNTKYVGFSPIEAAALNCHFEIVNMLMPLTTDVEYQTASLHQTIASLQLQEHTHVKICQFMEITNESEVIARSYLSQKHWNLFNALQSYLGGSRAAQFDSQNTKEDIIIQKFIDVTIDTNIKVAQCYLSQNYWELDLAVEAFFNYRETFSEWKKLQFISCQKNIENPSQPQQLPLDMNNLNLDTDQESNTSMPSLSTDSENPDNLIEVADYYAAVTESDNDEFYEASTSEDDPNDN